jgi:large subunit ribosomal protein L29
MARESSFKNQSREELVAISKDLSHEIFALRNELKMTRKIDKPHLLKEKKKERARALTALHQKGEG